MRTETYMNQLMRPREAAEWLQLSERTLWTLTQKGEITSIRIGRSVRYDVADLIEFVEARKVEACS